MKEIENSTSNHNTEAFELELDLLMSRFEHLMKRRPLLLNSVLLRQNPHNVFEWLKRVEIFDGQIDKVIQILFMLLLY